MKTVSGIKKLMFSVLAMMSAEAHAGNYQASLRTGDVLVASCSGSLMVKQTSNNLVVLTCEGNRVCRITKDIAGNFTLTVNGKGVYSAGGWSGRSTCEEMAQEYLDSNTCLNISKNY